MSTDALQNLRNQRAELEAIYRDIVASISTDDIEQDIIKRFKLDSCVPAPSIVLPASSRSAGPSTTIPGAWRATPIPSFPDSPTPPRGPRSPSTYLPTMPSHLGDDSRGLRGAFARGAMGERLDEFTQNLDLVFLVDCTMSMHITIRHVAAKLLSILDNIGTEFPRTNMRVAFIGYRDIGCRQPFIVHPFNTPNNMRSLIESVGVEGNADDAEDVLGGYEKVFALDWIPGHHRVLLHFLDMPPHGRRFQARPGQISDRYLDVDPPSPHKPPTWLEECVRKLCEKRIHCNMFAVSEYAQGMLEKTFKEFETAFAALPSGKDKFKTCILNDDEDDDSINVFFKHVLEKISDSMIASGARRRA